MPGFRRLAFSGGIHYAGGSGCSPIKCKRIFTVRQLGETRDTCRRIPYHLVNAPNRCPCRAANLHSACHVSHASAGLKGESTTSSRGKPLLKPGHVILYNRIRPEGGPPGCLAPAGVPGTHGRKTEYSPGIGKPVRKGRLSSGGRVFSSQLAASRQTERTARSAWFCAHAL